jgi:gliding motility-associated-like protein
MRKELKQRILKTALFAAIALVGFSEANTLAQTCDNPTPLCGGESELSTEFTQMDMSAAPVSSCFTGDMFSFVRFHTTYLSTTEGVTVSLSNIDCSNTAVTAMVVIANPLDYCDIIQYSPVSDCITATSDTQFTTYDLYINTDYLVILNYQSGAEPSPCEIEVGVSGTPLTIEACCPTNIDHLESANIEVQGGDLGVGYQWDPSKFVDNPTAHNVNVTPETTTLFEVSGFVENCEYSDQVLIVVGTEIDVPNAFSPNGDLVNDFWNITGLASYTGSILTLYDRWGQQIMRTSSYPQPWDGTIGGQDVPVGTYYYVIELNQPGVDLEPITGSVAIIR